MWIFLPSGLLMPADVPVDLADKTLTDNGRLSLQVRGRIESHLSNFIRDYMAPMGLEFSEIEKTPQMDYNVRFYTTREDFGKALSQAVLDIDYKKFKPTAENTNADGTPRYKDGRAYHNVLNSIWGTLLQLAPAGGIWGTYSAENPRGAKRYTPSSSGGSGYGATLASEYGGWLDKEVEHDSLWDDFEDSYVPDTLLEGERLYMEYGHLPAEERREYLDHYEQRAYSEYVEHIEFEQTYALPTEPERKQRKQRKQRGKSIRRSFRKRK